MALFNTGPVETANVIRAQQPVVDTSAGDAIRGFGSIATDIFSAKNAYDMAAEETKVADMQKTAFKNLGDKYIAIQDNVAQGGWSAQRGQTETAKLMRQFSGGDPELMSKGSSYIGALGKQMGVEIVTPAAYGKAKAMEEAQVKITSDIANLGGIPYSAEADPTGSEWRARVDMYNAQRAAGLERAELDAQITRADTQEQKDKLEKQGGVRILRKESEGSFPGMYQAGLDDLNKIFNSGAEAGLQAQAITALEDNLKQKKAALVSSGMPKDEVEALYSPLSTMFGNAKSSIGNPEALKAMKADIDFQTTEDFYAIMKDPALGVKAREFMLLQKTVGPTVMGNLQRELSAGEFQKGIGDALKLGYIRVDNSGNVAQPDPSYSSEGGNLVGMRNQEATKSLLSSGQMAAKEIASGSKNANHINILGQTLMSIDYSLAKYGSDVSENELYLFDGPIATLADSNVNAAVADGKVEFNLSPEATENLQQYYADNVGEYLRESLNGVGLVYGKDVDIQVIGGQYRLVYTGKRPAKADAKTIAMYGYDPEQADYATKQSELKKINQRVMPKVTKTQRAFATLEGKKATDDYLTNRKYGIVGEYGLAADVATTERDLGEAPVATSIQQSDVESMTRRVGGQLRPQGF